MSWGIFRVSLFGGAVLRRYCCTSCRDRAFTQYYAFMASADGQGMSEKYHTLRSQYANAGVDGHGVDNGKEHP